MNQIFIIVLVPKVGRMPSQLPSIHAVELPLVVRETMTLPSSGFGIDALELQNISFHIILSHCHKSGLRLGGWRCVRRQLLGVCYHCCVINP